jgi:hypothetical protein
MKAISRIGSSRHRFTAMLLALASVGVTVAAETEPPAPSQPIEAAWKQREISFMYRSANNIYSCSALRSRVANLLRAVGVRDDMQIRIDGCDEFAGGPGSRNGGSGGSFDVQGNRGGFGNGNGGGFNNSSRFGSSRFSNDRNNNEQLAQVRIRLTSPVIATPEVLAAIEKGKGRRELLARVSGNAAAAFEDAGTFPARRAQIELSHKTVGLEAEECELLEQISNNVFRQLGVKIVRRSMICNPHENSRIPPSVTVDALVFAPVGAYIESKPAPVPVTTPATVPATAPASEPEAAKAEGESAPPPPHSN